ncbi:MULTISPECIES: DUF2871 domain-containing protein [unclassified Arthrobacter]|uniref:DUF2871 domain-containing protein n=1 Tax=unclassified Arthrobacter TaxID=235627 RepID=UPI002DF8EE57|nr:MULTISPECIES: DUF2871 domain-containing protein [unclassified Arthrobacter]MEC5192367.1 pheromone shutdown protein TraB [Arthrobacter sp. MP_M4]MEC5203852.1 pheromone shutdown protein TraB [Arthrobacter sp. MP_M7]
MKKLYYAALTYMIAGLVSGLLYREFTKANDFTGDSQLSVVHTHLLALGMLFFLTVLALDKTYDLSAVRMSNAFFWTYNAGLVLTTAMMVLSGVLTVQGATPSAAIAGISGLGHIGLTAGLVLLFITLGKRVSGKATSEAELTTAN